MSKLMELAKGFEEYSAVYYIEHIQRAQQLEDLSEEGFEEFMHFNIMEIAYRYVNKIINKEEVKLTISYLESGDVMTSEREKRIVKSLSELLEMM